MKKNYKKIFLSLLILVIIFVSHNTYAGKAIVNINDSAVGDTGSTWDGGSGGSANRYNPGYGNADGGLGESANYTAPTTTTGTSKMFSCKSLSGQKIVFADLITFVTCTISSVIIPLLVSLAIMVFIYGVITYIISADDEEKRKVGRSYILYGIIGIFVIVSVWGLVNILSNTFGISNTVPQLKIQAQ